MLLGISLFLLGLFIVCSLVLIFMLIGEQRKRSQNLEEIVKLSKVVEKQKKTIKEFENKREAYRLDVSNEKCSMIFPDIHIPGCEELSRETMIGHMKNISFTGIKVAAEFDVPIRDKLTIHIYFEYRGEKFDCEAIFLRKEEYLHQIPHLLYGLRFLRMDSKMQERLKLVLNYAQAERYKGSDPKENDEVS